MDGDATGGTRFEAGSTLAAADLVATREEGDRPRPVKAADALAPPPTRQLRLGRELHPARLHAQQRRPQFQFEAEHLLEAEPLQRRLLGYRTGTRITT